MSSITQKRTLIELETSLKDIPRPWLKFVESKLLRPKDSMCWLWTGALDKDDQPIMSAPKAGSPGKRTIIRVKRFIAEMFWDFPNHVEVVQLCGASNCLNPGHFYLTVAHHSQENRDAMVKEKKRHIRDYLNRKDRA